MIDYQALWRLPEEERTAWLRRETPRDRASQWHLSVIEGVETQASASTRGAGGPDLAAFGFAVWFLVNSARLGGFRPTYAAYWLLRFAVIARRTPHPGVPALLDADNAARYTLDSFPLSVQRYREVCAHWREADDDTPPDDEWRMAQGISWTAPSLADVRDQLTDPVLREEVDAWLAVADGG